MTAQLPSVALRCPLAVTSFFEAGGRKSQDRKWPAPRRVLSQKQAHDSPALTKPMAAAQGHCRYSWCLACSFQSRTPFLIFLLVYEHLLRTAL